MTTNAQTDRPPWREVVRRTAEEAAAAAHRFHGDSEDVSLVAGLNTAPARAAGRKRLEAIEAFWQQAMRELDGDDLYG